MYDKYFLGIQNLPGSNSNYLKKWSQIKQVTGGENVCMLADGTHAKYVPLCSLSSSNEGVQFVW